MKKCKYCGRAIRDEARFCLYCMNPLEEKKVIEIKDKRPVKAIVAAGASAVVTAGAVAIALSAGGAVNGAAHIREASYAPLTDTAAVTFAQSGPEDETELVILSLFASADQNGDETDAPEATAPETTESETTASETTVPETTKPETAKPETTGPETSALETAAPETTMSETTTPETASPETALPETAAPYSILPVGQIGYLTPGVSLSDKPFVSYGDWTGYRAEHTVRGEVVQYGDPLIYVYGDGEKAVFEASPESLTGSPSDADAADLAYSMLCRVTGALPGSLCDAEGNDVNALMRSVTNYGGEGYDGILTSLCLPDEHRRVLYTYGMIPEFSRSEFTIGGERSMRVTFEIRRWFSLTSGICVVDCVTLIEYAD